MQRVTHVRISGHGFTECFERNVGDWNLGAPSYAFFA